MIDPAVHAQQRFLATRGERKCARCGRRTRDQTGTCAPCRRGSIPNLQSLTVDQLRGIAETVREELQRRRDEIDAAIGLRASEGGGA